MANETQLDKRGVFEDEPLVRSSQNENVTASWGAIQAKPGDRIFEPVRRRTKAISSWQIALELILAALILLLFL